MVTESGRVRSDNDFIFYGQLRSACGSIEHTGDNRTGAGDGDDTVTPPCRKAEQNNSN
jgi:tellurium resistance protein TerD